MIRVTLQPEYTGFDDGVRQRGARFLTSNPNPTSAQFRNKNFWNLAIKELHAAYSNICAYTAMYIVDGTVDHFLPKTTHPQLAYEWANYRLAGGKANNSKGNSTGVVDPFEVENHWFRLKLPSCLIVPNPEFDAPLKARINATVNILRLNSDDSYVQERCNILISFATGEVKFAFLQKRYPFLALEVDRLGFKDGGLADVFKV